MHWQFNCVTVVHTWSLIPDDILVYACDCTVLVGRSVIRSVWTLHKVPSRSQLFYYSVANIATSHFIGKQCCLHEKLQRLDRHKKIKNLQ